MEAIRKCLPHAVSFNIPKGGLYLWRYLPEKYAADDLLLRASQAGVSFIPGRNFFPDKRNGKNFLRLNFAAQSQERIREGIMRLGEVMTEG